MNDGSGIEHIIKFLAILSAGKVFLNEENPLQSPREGFVLVLISIGNKVPSI